MTRICIGWWCYRRIAREGQEAWASTSLWNSMRDPSTLLLVNNKGADQPAHSRSLVSAFVIRYLKSKVTRSDISQFSNLFGGLQLDKASG